MITDAQNEFCNAQAITAAADSENVIDLGVARDIGSGENLFVAITVTTTFDDTGDDSTLQVDLVTDDNAALSSDTVIQTLLTIPALAAAGTQYFVRISPETVAAFERYLGLAFTPGNGNLSAGAITAQIVKDIQQNVKYPNNSVIDA